MIGHRQEFYAQVNQVADAILLGLSFWLAYTLRAASLFDIDFLHEIPPFVESLWMLAVVMPFGPLFLEMNGFYSHPLQASTARRIGQIARAGLWIVLFFGLCVIFLRVQVPSRSVLLLFGVFCPAVLLLRDRIAAWYYRRAIVQGHLRENIILAGEEEAMKRFWKSLSPTLRIEFNAVEQVNLNSSQVEELSAALHRHSVGRVVLCFQNMEMDKVQRAIEACELEGVEAWLGAEFIHTSVARPAFDTLSGRPMLVFRATPELSWSILAKAVMDRVGAAVALVLLSPVMLFIAALIKWTSPGPVLFRQVRSGLHGKEFTMLKFRSMVPGAEYQREELAVHNEMSGPVFKISNDPRITPLGRFLRRTSLDETPQLINVLRGEMSLVGPRPLPTYEVLQFGKHSYRRRLSMKPGLTCLWQVRGRNRVTNFEEWVQMDLEYIDNWSLGLDLIILLRTVPAVLFGSGAK